MGVIAANGWIFTADHVDIHSEITNMYYLPAAWPDGQISLRNLLRRAK